MPSRLLILSLIVAPPLLAQDSSSVKPVPPRVTVGVTTGTMGFRDQRVQQGVTGVVRYHIWPAVSIAASPTFARIAFP